MVYIQSANHIQVVNNKVTSNVNKKTEKLVSLLLPTTIFSGVVNRRACLRDVIITNFYMADWAVLAAKAACNYSPFWIFPLFSSCSGLHIRVKCTLFYLYTYLYFSHNTEESCYLLVNTYINRSIPEIKWGSANPVRRSDIPNKPIFEWTIVLAIVINHSFPSACLTLPSKKWVANAQT